MRFLLTALAMLTLAAGAYADKPGNPDDVFVTPLVECEFEVVTYDWNFATGDQGFTTATCDDTGGEPMWAWGNEAHFGNCWGTVLDGNYPNNAGEALVSPTFAVSEASYLVQVAHYFDTELNFDGCNVKVNGTVIEPMGGYTIAAISTSTTYYAYCVDGEPGFSGHDLADWAIVYACFDLTEYYGQDVALSFELGADSSVQYPGWYLTGVQVGGLGVATESETWGTIKSLYR